MPRNFTLNVYAWRMKIAYKPTKNFFNELNFSRPSFVPRFICANVDHLCEIISHNDILKTQRLNIFANTDS